MCVCVCVCVCVRARARARAPVCPSPIVEPKPIDRSRSKSISRVLSQISRVFYFPLTPKIKGSSHKKKNFDFLKNGSNDD